MTPENHIKKLLEYIGDNPDREGLLDTPKRVIKAYSEWFKGYKEDPKEILQRTFDEVEGYDDIIILRNIRFSSHCEHHMTPILGTVSVGYLPNNRVVGISKLARVVDSFAKRLQIQEVFTKQIADVIQEVLKPKGVAVIVRGHHLCIGTRGANKPESEMITSSMSGVFMDNPQARSEFLLLERKA